jgi:hypothetical protein
MDIGTIAAAATPILIKGVETFSQKLGEKASEEIDGLYQKIRARLSGDSYAEQTLTRAKQMPESKGRQAALEEVIAEKMNEDPDFAENVRQLVEKATASGGGNVISYGERSVAIGRDAKGNTIITGDNNAVSDKKPSSD